MLNCRALFEGKNITVLGLGLLGRGLGDVAFLAQCGAHVLVTDKRTEEQLAASVEQLKEFKSISFKLGGHDKKDFTNCDFVIKAAGVPLDSPEIAAARDAGVPVAMSTALFAKYAAEAGAAIIGVTGTRGKSTVAHMMYHVLKNAGRRAHLGGNVRGISTLALLPNIEKGDVAVLELDSWQLQGFGDLQVSPHIAIVTNLLPDHMNYYGGDMERYFADKANIFRFQKKGDALFAGPGVIERIEKMRSPVAATVPPAIPAAWALNIPGEHNRENASLAAAALRGIGLKEEDIRSGIESFAGVEGRLQFVGEVQGVKIYNDNSATTPDATIAALRAVGGEPKRIVLIMGGDDKKLDMSKLIEEIPKRCSKVVLFKERGTDTVRDAILKMKEEGTEVYEEEGLEATVRRAFAIAKRGETILYSPAFASFGKYFANEFDRSDQFMKVVRNLSPGR